MGGETSIPSTGTMEGFGGGGSEPSPGYEYNLYNDTQQSNSSNEKESPNFTAKTTFSLGKRSLDKKKNNIMHLMAEEDNFSLRSPDSKEIIGHQLDRSIDIPSYPLSISLEEKIFVTVNREAGIEHCEIKGTLFLTANSDTGTMACVLINKSLILSKCTKNWSFATHPKVLKPDYENKGILTLKGSKGLPLKRPVGVLKWSYHGEDACPLMINCWPEDEGSGSMNINIEYELMRPGMTLRDVNILIPVGTTDNPSIESIDGQYTFNANAGLMCWYHDLINSTNSTGSLEFSILGSNVDDFFPVHVEFKSDSLLCPVDVTDVTHTSDGSAVPNVLHKSVSIESYKIG